MDLKNCGRKFAVITSQRHRDGGFEAALPDGTMWVVDEESNPDVRKKLLEAMRRNVDIAIIDEAGSAHPDVLYPDVCAFKQDLKDSKRTMQVMVIASTDHFTEDDPYMGQLLACGVYDVIGTDDKRNVGEAIADMMSAPSTLEEVEARIGASAPKGALAKAGAWFGRKDRKAKKKEKEKAKKGRKEEKAADEQAPMEPKTLADSLSSEDAAEGGMKPLTTAPSETAMAMRMLEDSGKLPRLGEDGEPAVEAREDPVEAAAAQIRAVGARVEPDTAATIGTRDESQGAEEPGTQNESQGADERWTQNESREETAAAPVAADPVPAAAQAIERGAGSPAADAAMVPADLAMRLEAMMSARLEEEMARREEEMREKYDRMLGDALRQGRAQRTVAVFSAVPAMTAEAALEAVAYVKRALPKANALMVEHDASRLPFLEPYGAAAPGDGDAAPDVVVRDFGCDAAAAMACRAEARLFVCSPTPWSVEEQAEAWNALEGRDGLHCCIPARGPRASAIAEAVTGSKEHLCLPDPSHFAAKPVFVPRDFEAAMGGIVATAYTVLRRRLRIAADSRAAMSLAGAALLGMVLVPYAKYPPNPPAVGDPATIDQRTISYLAMVVIGLVAVWAAVVAARTQQAEWRRAAAAVLGFLVVTTVGYVLLPTVDEVPTTFPPSLLWNFRITSLGTQVLLWTALGLAFSALVTPRKTHTQDPVAA